MKKNVSPSHTAAVDFAKKAFRFLSLFIAFLSCSCFANAQGIISTIVGNGTAGYSGDGGAATAAELYYPTAITLDGRGNLYIPEFFNNVIRKVNASGVITTFAGNGTAGFSGDGGAATAAQLYYPQSVVIDGSGNMYISEGYNNRIRKVDTSGIITTIAGNGTAAYSGDGGAATAAELNYPVGVTIDGSGNIYIGDYLNNRVRKINSSGVITTIAGNGTAGYSGDGGAATAAELYYPAGIVVDAVGNVYISDSRNDRIRKVSTSGIITTVAGNGSGGYSGDGGLATAAQIYSPIGIAMDGGGNLYFAEQANHRVRRVSTSGIITTFAGNGASAFSGDGGAATAAELYHPYGVAIDGMGNAYIADYSNQRIRKVTGSYLSTSHVADSFGVYINKLCSGAVLNIVTRTYSVAYSVKCFYGDGSTDSSAVFNLSGAGFVSFTHAYSTPGTYTIKSVLMNGGVVFDSLSFTYVERFCNTFSAQYYYESNSNCTKDSGEAAVSLPVLTEIDSNGVAVDTISCTGGFYYTAFGAPGDIYAFKVVSAPAALHATCPSTGIIYDTLGSSAIAMPAKAISFSCGSSTFDLGIRATTRTSINRNVGSIYANNAYCFPTNGTVVLNFDSRFAYVDAIPTPTSSTATSLTWNLSGLSCLTGVPDAIFYGLDIIGSYLSLGDTVQSSVSISPATGDVDTFNNHKLVTDTARAGFDPNAIYVQPGGCIASGATPVQLQYTITFENTGNDTAHNIYVVDTLPDYLDVSTMRIEMSSHEMYTYKYKNATGQNILKFNFPQINLQDSSHHGHCDGAVVFNIKSKPGLSIGTNIMNRAGIYFDINNVVMTNEIANGIGCPVISEVNIIQPPLGMLVYPNPVTNLLQIDNVRSAATYKITNVVGETILQGRLQPGSNSVSVPSLIRGVYLIELTNADGSRVVKKVVKE